MKKFKTVTCKSCGWVQFGVTRAYAENAVKEFNEYFHSLSVQQREDYYGNKEATIKFYERCFCCGRSHTNFRPSKKKDSPLGCTMQPIIIGEK